MSAVLPHTSSYRHSPLFWVILLGISVALHALLLWLWPEPPARTLNLGQKPVQVSYHETRRSPAATASKPGSKSGRPAQKPEPAITRQPAALTRPRTSNKPTRIVATSRQPQQADKPAPTPVPARKTPAASSASRAATLSLSQKRQRARKQISDLLVGHFNYPVLAVNQGWEGDVGLSVTIMANGRLDRITLTRSSGYNVLDRAAVRSMQSIRLLPGSKAWLDRKPLTLSYNVVYRLNEE